MTLTLNSNFSPPIVLNVQLVLVKLQLELSFKSSSKKRVLGLGLEVKSWNILLNLRVNLNKLVVSLLELNLDSVALGVGLSLDGALNSSTTSSSLNLDFKVSINLLQIKVLCCEIQFIGGDSILDNHDLGLLSGNTGGSDLEISSLGGVDIAKTEFCLSVRLNLEV